MFNRVIACVRFCIYDQIGMCPVCIDPLYVMSEKEKRKKVLKVEDKLDGIKRFKKKKIKVRLTISEVQKKSTIIDIKNSVKIIKISTCERNFCPRRNLKIINDDELDQITYRYYKNETLTLLGSLIQEKAFDLNKKLDSNRNFKASSNYQIYILLILSII